jgi:hypothetical protein
MNTTLTLKNVRLAFSDSLTEAKAIQGGKPRYGCTLIIEDDATLKEVEAAIKAIATAEFKGNVPPGKDSALRDGNLNTNKEDEVYKGFENKWFLSANRADSLGAPLILDNKRDPATGKPRVITDKTDIKFPEAGDYVNARINLFSLNGKSDRKANPAYGKKICCGLEVVQFAAKGEPFGASKPTADGFDAEDEDMDDLS